VSGFSRTKLIGTAVCGPAKAGHYEEVETAPGLRDQKVLSRMGLRGLWLCRRSGPPPQSQADRPVERPPVQVDLRVAHAGKHRREAASRRLMAAFDAERKSIAHDPKPNDHNRADRGPGRLISFVAKESAARGEIARFQNMKANQREAAAGIRLDSIRVPERQPANGESKRQLAVTQRPMDGTAIGIEDTRVRGGNRPTRIRRTHAGFKCPQGGPQRDRDEKLAAEAEAIEITGLDRKVVVLDPEDVRRRTVVPEHEMPERHAERRLGERRGRADAGRRAGQQKGAKQARLHHTRSVSE